MADKLKKYLSVLQLTSYSPEFKDLVAEQLLQLCQPTKSTNNFLNMLDILTGEPVNGQFKKQHLGIIKGLFKYVINEKKELLLESLLRAAANDKKSGFEEYVKSMLDDSFKSEAEFTYKGIKLSRSQKSTMLSITQNSEFRLMETVDKCEPLLGEKAEEEKKDGNPKKVRGKKSASKSNKKIGVSNYLEEQPKRNQSLNLPKNTELGLKIKHKKATETEKEDLIAGEILVENILLQVYFKLLTSLLSDSWYPRHISAVILKELLNIVEYKNFSCWFLCNIEISISSQSDITLNIVEVKALPYDSSCIEALHCDLFIKIIAVIMCDQFTDYLENTISTPVRESFGNLLSLVLSHKHDESPIWPIIVEEIKEMILNLSYEWMSRYNAMLILKVLVFHWKKENTLEKYFESIKSPLLKAISSEDEIKIVTCHLLRECRTLVCKDTKYYFEVIEAVFDNLKTADDIECSSIEMMKLLDILFLENPSLIPSAVQYIDIKLIFIFAYHKLASVRQQAYSLIFKLVIQLYDAIPKESLEKLCPSMLKEILNLLQISIQGVALENDAGLLKEIKRGFINVLQIENKNGLQSWFAKKREFLLSLVQSSKVTDFKEFLFYSTTQYTASLSYYSFIGEPITSSEIFTAFYSKAYNLNKLFAALSLKSAKIEQELTQTFAKLLEYPVAISSNTDISLFFFYWITKKQLGSNKDIALQILNQDKFNAQLSIIFNNDELTRLGFIIREFSSQVQEKQDLIELLNTDIQTDSTINLNKYYSNLQQFYQDRKQKGDSETRLNAIVNLLMEVSKINDWVANEINKIKALASAIVINCGKLENKVPEKLNPIIKPLMTSIQKEQNPYVHKIASRALAELQFLNQNNQTVNEKIQSLLISSCFSSSGVNVSSISIYLKHYIKLFKENAFVANNKSLQRYCTESLNNYVESKYSAVNSKNICQELELLKALLTFSIFDLHKTFIEDSFLFILRLISIIGIEVTQNGNGELLKDNLDKEIINEATEDTLKEILLSCSKLIGKDCYENLTVTFIQVIQKKALNGTRLLSHFISDVQKDYLPYIPYYILPIIRNFSASTMELSVLSYQLFSNILKILPLNNPELFSSIPKLTTKSPEAAIIEAKGKEGVEFLKSFLVAERKYKYPLQIELKHELRSYQKDGVSWMAFMHNYNINCALCDDMGLGKTVEALVLIANETHNYKLQENKKPPPSLVVCPSTLTKNWLYEIPKFFENSALSGHIYQGAPSSSKDKESLTKLAKKYNIIITSYERVRAEINEFKKIEYYYIVLDEAHIIKNSKAKITQAVKQLTGQRKLILSGTPLHNNVTEIWSLFDFLNPGFLGSESQFEQTYTRHLMTNLKKINEKIEDTSDFGSALESLKQRIAPFILRRTKQDVLKELPPKNILDYPCRQSQMQKLMLADLSENHPLDCKPTQKDGEIMLQRIQWHLYLCNHPKLIISKNILSKTCVDQIKSELSLHNLDSLEYIHSGKLLSLAQLLTECGILPENLLHPESNPADEKNSSLIDELVETQAHRALIFCQKITMLDIIENDFLKKFPMLKYLRLDSRVDAESRVDVAKRFNEDTSFQLLLLTTKVGGYGLTLTGADTVIFYDHDWNPMNDLQAMDRTHRIGQTRTVNVYRLILTETIEEKVLNFQKFKENLAKSLIENEKTTSDKLNLQEMFESFAEKAETAAPQKKKPQGKMSYIDEIALKWAETDTLKNDDLE